MEPTCVNNKAQKRVGNTDNIRNLIRAGRRKTGTHTGKTNIGGEEWNT